MSDHVLDLLGLNFNRSQVFFCNNIGVIFCLNSCLYHEVETCIYCAFVQNTNLIVPSLQGCKLVSELILVFLMNITMMVSNIILVCIVVYLWDRSLLVKGSKMIKVDSSLQSQLKDRNTCKHSFILK